MYYYPPAGGDHSNDDCDHHLLQAAKEEPEIHLSCVTGSFLLALLGRPENVDDDSNGYKTENLGNQIMVHSILLCA